MNAAERQKIILDLLLKDITTPEALGAHLDVALSTIRRDITELLKQGLIARAYDDQLIVLTARPEHLLSERSKIAYEQKVAIAQTASRFVQAGDTLMLDAGTTTGLFAREIRNVDLTVVTNGLATINMLSGAENIELVVLGGTLRHVSHGLTGPMAEQALQRMSADKAFVSADGVVMGNGLCETSISQAWLKELMIQRSREVFVLADSSKLGNACAQAWSPLTRPWTLITDSMASPEQIGPFLNSPSVTVVIAD